MMAAATALYAGVWRRALVDRGQRADASLVSATRAAPSGASPDASVPATNPVPGSARKPERLNPAPMSRSLPVAVTIPAIGVRAPVIPLGLDPRGGIAVPSLDTPFLTSWYDGGFAPGQVGPAALFGHVDSAKVGPAVFYRLGDLSPGDLVFVTRRDGGTAIFRVTSVAMYSERNFPTTAVYGFTPQPTLRLITCGGDFDTKTHLYLDRVIAFAAYAGQEPLQAG